jgi:hypothetical protein
MRLGIARERQPIESRYKTRRVWTDHQPRGVSPAQMQQVDAAIVRRSAPTFPSRSPRVRVESNETKLVLVPADGSDALWLARMPAIES